MDGGTREKAATGQPALPGIDLGPLPEPIDEESRDFWVARLRQALAERSPDLPVVADEALRACPRDIALLLLASLAAVAAGRPERSLSYLKRLHKKYAVEGEIAQAASLLTALCLAHQGSLTRAWAMVEENGLASFPAARASFVGGPEWHGWLSHWIGIIRDEGVRQRDAAARAAAARRKAESRTARHAGHDRPVREAPAPPMTPVPPALPRLNAAFDIRFELTNAPAIVIETSSGNSDWFRLRAELAQLTLLQGFDELLCLPALTGVETHWYQVETVRKVLKQFRGRVLLADEVGLGKTIEAGMVVKEYMLRGMAERLLILVPAALVGQWRDEMSAKFGIDCATSHDPLLRQDPAAFWAQQRVIASIATARRKEHADRLATLTYDVVVVDEAHHLRHQASASYRLVNLLQKRFLLLLSATPVQNSLLELYNLLTLLQPGIFKTQKEFRAVYMTPGKPREPANRERLRDLMRGAMVRNTRALAALKLPRRHASTRRAAPDEAEAACYCELTRLARDAAAAGQGRLAAQHLLAAAGSSPAAAAAAIARFVERHPAGAGWSNLLERYRTLGPGAKEAALLDLVARNPAEKKMVFVHHRDSLAHLADLMRRRGFAFTVFDGSLSGPEKDAAVAAFRYEVPLLLCSESGGEGRNLQFCNSLINFDIPWNPMAIEQRIGRIDRIGQTREVFVFNLATAATIEDEVLRILDDKITMFELVVGEVGAILGELDEEQDFPGLVLDAWLQSSNDARKAAFAALEDRLLAARRTYEDARQLDDALFAEDFEAA